MRVSVVCDDTVIKMTNKPTVSLNNVKKIHIKLSIVNLLLFTEIFWSRNKTGLQFLYVFLSLTCAAFVAKIKSFIQ